MQFRDLPLEKWTWIELIGFDNTAPDYGVGDFLARAGFVPTGVSLLFSWIGFVMDETDFSGERLLSPADASYFGHPASRERKRQDWTNYQLRGLISQLHKAGCRVLLCFFDFDEVHMEDGTEIDSPFFRDKLYLREKWKEGTDAGGISMLKRLTDGRYVEDLVQESAMAAVRAYGFDGVEIADGISSPRGSLQESDYSEDMLEQFSAATGITVPRGENAPSWIWQNRRYAWIRFHTRRWETFYRKFAARLKREGKIGVFHCAWTKDPFEAMYRYGVDYRILAGLGFYGCMFEDVSAGLGILSERDNLYLMTDEQRKRIFYEFRTNLMLCRAAMPEGKLLSLSGIHDMTEQWGVLEHMPTAMSTDVFGNLNTWFLRGGQYQAVTDGPFFCLSDALRGCDWEYIRRQWECGYSGMPERVTGCTLVWSDERLDRELEAFCARRTTPTQRLVSEMLYGGSPIAAVVRIEELQTAAGPILVTNPALLPEEEWNMVEAYRGGSVFLLGEGAERQGYTTLVREENGFGNMALTGKGCADRGYVSVKNEAEYPFDPHTSPEPGKATWTHPLAFSPISSAFFLFCAETLEAKTDAPAMVDAVRVSDCGVSRRVCKLLCSMEDEKHARVVLMNDDYYYNHPKVDFHRRVRRVTCVTRYEGYRVPTTETGFFCRVAGRGADVFDVELE